MSKELDLLLKRLDEVRMTESDRIRAKAHLARAEAVADAVAGVGPALRRLYRRLVVRPLRRVSEVG
jgi:nitric oxide reductase activation protein